jgi:hypothetical protein
MVVGFTKKNAVQSVSISSIPVHDEVYSIQHYVIKFVSDLRQVGGFLRIQHYVIKFVSDLRQVGGFIRYSNLLHRKTDLHDITEILLKVALNTINESSIYLKKKKSIIVLLTSPTFHKQPKSTMMKTAAILEITRSHRP